MASIFDFSKYSRDHVTSGKAYSVYYSILERLLRAVRCNLSKCMQPNAFLFIEVFIVLVIELGRCCEK